MVNNHQYNKNYYLTICICISSGSGTESVVLPGISSSLSSGTSKPFVDFVIFYVTYL